MRAATKLNKQINDYLIQLNDKQKRAVLKVIKSLVEEQEYGYWKDLAFIAEQERRTVECENGKAKVLILDELVTRYESL